MSDIEDVDEKPGASCESSGSEEPPSVDEVKFEGVPSVKIHHPKDPRSKAKYNIFSRLLLW